VAWLLVQLSVQLTAANTNHYLRYIFSARSIARYTTMNVRELLELLSTQDPDTPVVARVWNPSGNSSGPKSVNRSIGYLDVVNNTISEFKYDSDERVEVIILEVE
jgi:hypothetical protein